MRKNKKRVYHIVGILVSIGIFLLLPGCEELLNEALAGLFAVEETVIENETVTAENATIPVASDYTLTKTTGSLSKSTGIEIFPVNPPEMNFFLTALAYGGASLTGNLTNNGETAVDIVFYVHDNNTDPIASATLIVEFTDLTGTQNFDFDLASIPGVADFFDTFTGTTFYVYVSAEPSDGFGAVNVNLNIGLELHAVDEIVSEPIFPSDELADFIEANTDGGTVDVTDVDITGSVTNNSAYDVLIIASVKNNDDGSTLAWEGDIVNFDIGPGQTVDLADYEFTTGGQDKLEGCLEYLSDTSNGPVYVVVTFVGTDIDVTIHTIVLSGSVGFE